MSGYGGGSSSVRLYNATAFRGREEAGSSGKEVPQEEVLQKVVESTYLNSISSAIERERLKAEVKKLDPPPPKEAKTTSGKKACDQVFVKLSQTRCPIHIFTI